MPINSPPRWERESVIVTRHGIGSFVADRADLSVQLRRTELDEHLSAAADIGRQLGMTPDELTSRLQSIARGNANDAKDEKDQ